MTHSPILDKGEMYRRLNAGLLGHTLPAAETLEDAVKLVKGAPPGAQWGLRFKQAGGKTRFGLSSNEALSQAATHKPGSFNLSPMLDDTKRVCYCHLTDEPGGWRLHYSTDPKPCSLKQYQDGCEQRHLTGLRARLYLRSVMDQPGWDTLTELVDAYPDHCVEFTVMASRLDAFGPSNTIFWEVREATTGVYESNSRWGCK